MYNFHISGYIPAKQSVRDGKHSHYQPQGLVEAEMEVRRQLEHQALEQLDFIIAKPIFVDILYRIPISQTSLKLLEKYSDQDGRLIGLDTDKIFCATKPDVDNIQKFILDCMKGIVIMDDARIVDVHLRKIYTRDTELSADIKVEIVPLNRYVYEASYFRDKPRSYKVFKSQMQKEPLPEHRQLFDQMLAFCVSEFGIDESEIRHCRRVKSIYIKKYITKLLYDHKPKCPYIRIATLFGDKDHQPVKQRIDTLNNDLEFYPDIQKEFFIIKEFYDGVTKSLQSEG